MSVALSASLDDTFDAKLASYGSKPVILFFGSESCAATIWMWPEIDQFMQATEGDFEFLPISIETAPKTTRRFVVKATPCSILVVNGVPLGTIIGTMTHGQMIEWADGLLLPPEEKKKVKKKAPA